MKSKAKSMPIFTYSLLASGVFVPRYPIWTPPGDSTHRPSQPHL